MSRKFTAFQWTFLIGMTVGFIVTMVGTATGTLGFIKMW